MDKWSEAKKRRMTIRRIAQGRAGEQGLSRVSPSTGHSTTMLIDVDTAGPRSKRMATVASVNQRSSTLLSPAAGIARDISEALDPTRAPSKVRAFKDMSPEEQEQMRLLYEKK